MKKLCVIFTFIFICFANISSVNASSELLKLDTKDKVMLVEEENGKFDYSWSFDKKDVKQDEMNFDPVITFKNKDLYDLDNLMGNKHKKKLISFNHHGTLPGIATIKVPVSDSFKEGDILSLYYYDEENERIELINKKIEVINGYATFEIKHCSDYFVTLSIVNDASKKGNSTIVIVGMIIVIVGLIGYTMFQNKK